MVGCNICELGFGIKASAPAFVSFSLLLFIRTDLKYLWEKYLNRSGNLQSQDLALYCFFLVRNLTIIL